MKGSVFLGLVRDPLIAIENTIVVTLTRVAMLAKIPATEIIEDTTLVPIVGASCQRTVRL